MATMSPEDITGLENVTEGVTHMQSLDEKGGWFINLDSNRGEKVLGPPVVLFGVAYFTTFTPRQIFVKIVKP